MADTLALNTSDFEISRAREQFLGGLFGALDQKRPTARKQYGYPDEITFEKLLSAYARGGAGHGAVHRLLRGAAADQEPRIRR